MDSGISAPRVNIGDIALGTRSAIDGGVKPINQKPLAPLGRKISWLHTTPKAETREEQSSVMSVKFQTAKHVKIPSWATHVHFQCNGIDGYPPSMPAVLTVAEFMAQAEELQNCEGAGEWDVLVYATNSSNEPTRLYPYGKDNPYTVRRNNAKCGRCYCIANWDYMRWAFNTFSLNEAKGGAL